MNDISCFNCIVEFVFIKCFHLTAQMRGYNEQGVGTLARGLLLHVQYRQTQIGQFAVKSIKMSGRIDSPTKEEKNTHFVNPGK